ncbi:hypothetical protein [Pectinatus sottacetonis]|uniref:hypothetical protein n=1 Tax=Pectinatus sottacetonis TaxID=1002795 RepID=UPI0018C55002|nr:hypothetical protein [Pectinatus sottacetonis]
MFLNLLNETEGKNFLELAKIAMDADGIIKESEKKAFNTYQSELNLQNYQLKDKSYDSLVTIFQGSTKRVKKVIIIELSGILDADEEIDVNEQNWIKKLGIEWGFRDSEIKKMIRWTQDFNDLVKEACEFINKR